MPESSTLIVSKAKDLLKQIIIPADPLPLDQAMAKIRETLKSISFNKRRAALAVWLFKLLTQRDPTVVTIIEILNHESLEMSQTDANGAINDLLSEHTFGKQGILVKSDEGDRLSLSNAILKQINEA